MNKKISLLSLCSFIISSSYSMQQPPVKSLTLAERKENAKRAYRACAQRMHLKYAECYNEETETIKTENGQCNWTKHVECWKVAQEKFTEGFFEETKEFFESKK